MLEDTFLTQIVTRTTRGNNLLDVVLVSDSDLTRECQVGDSREKVEILNKNFPSVFTVEKTQSVPESPTPSMRTMPLEIGTTDETNGTCKST